MPVARFLERRGILERDEDNCYLTLDGLETDPLLDIHSHSVTYRVAIAPQKGRKVFAPNSKHLLMITPSGRGKVSKDNHSIHPDDRTPAERHAAMTWVQRLKLVFNIDIGTYEQCQGPFRIFACVEDPAVIRQILAHLSGRESADAQARLPPERGRRSHQRFPIPARPLTVSLEAGCFKVQRPGFRGAVHRRVWLQLFLPPQWLSINQCAHGHHLLNAGTV